jgi:aerobic-type carbon monoxide dehydrogenase small subunit (CoxS/CutS family)
MICHQRRQARVDVDPQMPLLWAPRDRLNMRRRRNLRGYCQSGQIMSAIGLLG